MNNAPLKSVRQKRFGLMKIKIDSNHVIKGPDGINRQFKTKDITRHPKLKTTVVCLACKKTWDTEEELIAAHPDERIMRKQEEPHPYGWWCDDLIVLKEKDDKTPKDPAKVVGFLSDEE